MNSLIYTPVSYRLKLKLFGCLLLMVIGVSTKAQSDLCGSATPITIQSEYLPQAYNITGFGDSGPALYTGTSNRDGWFQFTTGTTATAVLITAINDGTQPIAVSTYLTCSDLTAQSSIVPNNKTAILYASVLPSTTYCLRISRTTSAPAGNTGTICVQSINAVVSTHITGDINSEYIASEPNSNSTSTCAGSMNLTIPAGNSITTVSTLYSIRAYSPGLMEHQRSILSSPTMSTHEGNVAFGSGDAASTFKYERHNLTFAEGGTGTVSFHLNTWRTSQGSGCNATYNRVTNYTWTVIAYYTAAASCPSPALNTFHTDAFSTTTATLSWTAPAIAPDAGYEYVYSTSNAIPTGAGTSTSGTSINLSSLTAGTNYYLFVRGKCAETGLGNWTGPYHFNTAVCLPSAQCNYQLHMNNNTPSGWNGTVIGFKQNGVLVTTATLSSGSNAIISIPLCNNLNTEVYVKHLGSYSDEISFTLYDATGNIETTRSSGSSMTLNQSLDIFTSACPNCHAPSNVQVSYPGSTAVSIQWTAPGAAPANGYQYAVSTSSSFPTGAGTDVASGTSALVSSLSASTTYYVFVRSMCSPSEPSAWTGPLTITTSCSASTLTVSEGLNTASPACWETEIVTDGNAQAGSSPELSYVTASLNPSGLTPFEGSGFLRFNSYNCDSGDQIRLISTPFETSGLNGVDVDFIWNHDADFAANIDGVQVQYSFDKINWINAGSFLPRFSALINGWYPHSVSLPNAVIEQSHVYVAFLFTSHRGNDCYIDNIILRETPSCKKPTNVHAVHITNSFARIEWQASVSAPSNGYLWELRTAGAAGSGVTGLAASGSTGAGIQFAEIGSLNSLASYVFYVRSNCGGSELSDWTWNYSFRTVASVINSFPFDETFEAGSTTRAGWQNEYAFGNWNWTYATGAGGGDVTTAHTGTTNARFRSSSDIVHRTKLVSPPLNVASLSSGARLKFWYANQSWSGRQNELRVYYKTTYGAEWTLIPGAVYVSNQSTWTEVTLILPENGSDYYIAFEGLNKNSRGIVLDDIRVEPIECPIPTAHAVAGRNSAFIYWEIPGDASTKIFEWELRTAGEPGSGAIGLKSSATTSFGVLGRNVAGLTANTTYHLYVRTHCGTEDLSLWSDVYTFTTTNIAPPINDHPTAATSRNDVKFVYPSCFNINGTTVGATPSFHQDYNDVWYFFYATSNGVTIKLSNTSFDGALILMDAQQNVLDIENVTTTAQNETLNYGNLVEGNMYYVVVANYRPSQNPDGNFSLCLARFRKGSVPEIEYNLCSNMKSQSAGYGSYTFTFTPTGDTPGSETSVTTPTNLLQYLSIPVLGLKWGGTYEVKVDVKFQLVDGLGSIEVLNIYGTSLANITIVEAPLAQLAPELSCSVKTLTRANVISPVKAGTNNICMASDYFVEFTRVSDCEGNNPDPSTTFTMLTPNGGKIINLNYAFNTGGVPASSQTAGYWRVRWKPNFYNGGGSFGPHQIIKVNNTSGSSSGMSEGSSDELFGLNSEIITSVFPNPSNGLVLNVLISSRETNACEVKIFDSIGRNVYQQVHEVNDAYSTQITFNQKLPSGIYFIQYTIGQNKKTDKIIISE